MPEEGPSEESLVTSLLDRDRDESEEESEEAESSEWAAAAAAALERLERLDLDRELLLDLFDLDLRGVETALVAPVVWCPAAAASAAAPTVAPAGIRPGSAMAGMPGAVGAAVRGGAGVVAATLLTAGPGGP